MKTYSYTFDNETLLDAINFYTTIIPKLENTDSLLRIAFTPTFLKTLMLEYQPLITELFNILEKNGAENVQLLKDKSFQKYKQAYTWYVDEQGDSYAIRDMFEYLAEIYTIAEQVFDSRL